jgi:hypothetical protein
VSIGRVAPRLQEQLAPMRSLRSALALAPGLCQELPDRIRGVGEAGGKVDRASVKRNEAIGIAGCVSFVISVRNRSFRDESSRPVRSGLLASGAASIEEYTPPYQSNLDEFG